MADFSFANNSDISANLVYPEGLAAKRASLDCGLAGKAHAIEGFVSMVNARSSEVPQRF